MQRGRAAREGALVARARRWTTPVRIAWSRRRASSSSSRRSARSRCRGSSALLDAALLPTGQALLDAHLGVLRVGLGRLLLFERLVVPLPFLAGGAVLAAGGDAGARRARRDARGAIGAVLALGRRAAARAARRRAGGRARHAGRRSRAAGDVAGLPARFNVGVAGALAASGVAAPGWLGVAAEAANGVGLWVVALWAWGLSRLDRDASRSARGAHTLWWCVAAAAAYAAGWALYAALYPDPPPAGDGRAVALAARPDRRAPRGAGS